MRYDMLKSPLLTPAEDRFEQGRNAAAKPTSWNGVLKAFENPRVWQDPQGNVVETLTYSFDASGHPLTATDSAGAVTSTYNDQGQLTSQTDVFGLTLTYSYDAAGHVTQVTDSQGGVTTSEYNAAGQLTSITDTLGLARSNIAERVKGVRPKRGPQTRGGDLELTAAIHRFVDARPTYG